MDSALTFLESHKKKIDECNDNEKLQLDDRRNLYHQLGDILAEIVFAPNERSELQNAGENSPPQDTQAINPQTNKTNTSIPITTPSVLLLPSPQKNAAPSPAPLRKPPPCKKQLNL